MHGTIDIISICLIFCLRTKAVIIRAVAVKITIACPSYLRIPTPMSPMVVKSTAFLEGVRHHDINPTVAIVHEDIKKESLMARSNI